MPVRLSCNVLSLAVSLDCQLCRNFVESVGLAVHQLRCVTIDLALLVLVSGHACSNAEWFCCSLETIVASLLWCISLVLTFSIPSKIVRIARC
jgi:hypothetical protein